MEAIILLAGYGSRLDRNELPHKGLLPFGEETLISRHLKCFQVLGIQKTHLILGHNAAVLKSYVQGLNLDLPVHFIDNSVYRTTGNTFSMVMGLKHCQKKTLILDGDIFYPPEALINYVQQAPRSSFALVPADINDAECAKVLLNPSGTINAFITKRALTEEEKSGFGFGGEAIGFLCSARKVSFGLSLFTKMMNPPTDLCFGKPRSRSLRGTHLCTPGMVWKKDVLK